MSYLKHTKSRHISVLRMLEACNALQLQYSLLQCNIAIRENSLFCYSAIPSFHIPGFSISQNKFELELPKAASLVALVELNMLKEASL